MARGVISVLAALGICLSGPAVAKDYGTFGTLFPVTEPSVLEVIEARLTEMEGSGELAAWRDDLQDRTKSYVARPRPVEGLMRAEAYRTFDVDLSITLDRDLSDHQGQVFAARGTVVNPLDFSGFDKRIIFFDGDDPAQVEYALSSGNELDTLLVLVKGAPLDLMRTHGRRFWFDQGGHMVEGFRIARLPSVVTRADPVMRVEEIPLGAE